MITAKNNAQLKQITALLKKRSEREEAQAFVCEGRKMFFEVLRQAPELLKKAYWSQKGFVSLTAEERAEIEACPYEIVADDVFDHIAETVTPQGVIAIVRMPHYTIEQMLSQAGVRLLLPESLRDPGNLGTIIRTAEAAGMTGVILSADSVDIFNPKVVRATMGGILRVPFVYAEDYVGTLRYLKEQGVTLYAAHLQGSVPYTEPEYGERYGIMIGNEANGLSDEATEEAQVRVRIPMEGQVESLNAAVAAAVLMFHAKNR